MLIHCDCPHCGGCDLYDIDIQNQIEIKTLKCHWCECEKEFEVEINVIVENVGG